MSLGSTWCPISERESTSLANHPVPHVRVGELFEQALKEYERMETALTHTQLLTNKHAVIFGAGGAVGTAVAKEFAAQVCLLAFSASSQPGHRISSSRHVMIVESKASYVAKKGGKQDGSLHGSSCLH